MGIGFYEKNKILVLTFSIVLLMFITAFLVRPIIIGYTTYQKVKDSNNSIEEYSRNLEELKTKLLVASTNLSSCVDSSSRFSFELERYLDKSADCVAELKGLGMNFTFMQQQYEKDAGQLRNQLADKDSEIREMEDDKNAEISVLKTKYDLLAQNSANNICCKAKVDNPKIKYYSTENSKISCLEEGANALSC